MDEKKVDRSEDQAIDLSRLMKELSFVWRRLFWLPVLLALILGGLWYLRAKSSYVPMYASEATFTIEVSNSSSSDVSGTSAYYDKATAEQLGKTFPYLIQSDLLYSKICRVMGVSSLNGSISAWTVANTNLFTIRVTSSDPKMALTLLEKTIEVYPQVADYVIGNTVMNLLTQPVEASAPINSFRPVPTFAKAAVAGFLLGLALLVLRAASRKTVREPEEIQKKLNQTCLATLPRVVFKRRGKKQTETMFLLNKHLSGSFQEGIRSLRIKLLRQLPQQGCKVILVTSTMPGEGKSVVSANLAMSLAQNGARVVLMDLDLRKPSIKKTIGLQGPSKGMVELLDRKETDVTPYLQQIDGASLWVLAGDAPARSAQQLTAKKLTAYLDGLRGGADFIILDTPPCGLLADSANLARAADGAVYITGYGAVEVPHILDGMQFLMENGTPILGCVLNGVPGGRGGYGYGYGYGYGDGYGYRSNQHGRFENHERSGT